MKVVIEVNGKQELINAKDMKIGNIKLLDFHNSFKELEREFKKNKYETDKRIKELTTIWKRIN